MRVGCDRMLGRLARWLRMMGVDAEYPAEMDDRELTEMCISEGRILLTRDRELALSLGGSVHLMEAHDLEGQIAAFTEAFGMPEDWFTRCTTCNGILSSDEAAAVRGRVPEGVQNRFGTFWTCRRCGQVYWPGTHFEGIGSHLASLSGGVSDHG
jgi:uncharacterized protein with PIN domain